MAGTPITITTLRIAPASLRCGLSVGLCTIRQHEHHLMAVQVAGNVPSAVQAVLLVEIARLAATAPLVVAPSAAVVPVSARPLPAPPVVLSAVRPRATVDPSEAADAAFHPAAAGPSAVVLSAAAVHRPAVPQVDPLVVDHSEVVRSAEAVLQGAGDRLAADRLEADGLHLAVGAAGRALPTRPFVVPIIAVQARPLWD